MNFAANTRYFTYSLKDKNAILRFIISGVLIIGGFAAIRYLRVGSWIVSNLAGAVLFVIAGALLITLFSKQTKGVELDSDARHMMDKFEAEVEAQLLPAGNARQMKLSEERGKHCARYRFHAYVLKGEHPLFKHGSDGAFRTSICSGSVVRLFKEEIGVGVIEFSLIAEQQDSTVKTVSYESLEEVAAISPSLPGLLTAQYVNIPLKTTAGSALLTISAPTDSETDAFVAELNRRIHNAHKAAAAAE